MALHHILIVDDQHDVRRMLRAGLETLGSGVRVDDVPSGEEGMLLISRSPVDLLVADVRLPGISGLELIQRTRARNPQLKLILITGLTDPAIQQQVARAGADAFFYKPIEMSDFLDTVERILGLVQGVFSPLEKAAPAEPLTVSQAAPPPLDPAPRPSTGRLPAGTPRTLADHLASLRQSIGAFCVLLLDDQGAVRERADQLPDPGDEAPLIQAALPMLAAGGEVSRRLGIGSGENLLYYTGARADLFLIPVNESAVLLLVAPANPDPAWVGTVRRLFTPALPEIAALLSSPDLLQQDPAEATGAAAQEPAPAAAPQEPLPELDALFERASGSLKSEEVDAFWDALADQESPGEAAGNSRAISYEQARKLGLAPGEEARER